MKLKITFSIICFCLLINCNGSSKTKESKTIINKEQQRNCIDYVLKQDDSLGTIRNHACEATSLSNTIKQYVNSVNTLDFKNCPDNFNIAFQNHLMAWKDMGQLH